MWKGTPDEVNSQLSYTVGRYWLGAENIAAEALGQEGRSVPSYPGVKMFPVDTAATDARQDNDAARSIKEMYQQYNRDGR
jgi:hypothetical protein